MIPSCLLIKFNEMNIESFGSREKREWRSQADFNSFLIEIPTISFVLNISCCAKDPLIQWFGVFTHSSKYASSCPPRNPCDQSLATAPPRESESLLGHRDNQEQQLRQPLHSRSGMPLCNPINGIHQPQKKQPAAKTLRRNSNRDDQTKPLDEKLKPHKPNQHQLHHQMMGNPTDDEKPRRQ